MSAIAQVTGCAPSLSARQVRSRLGEDRASCRQVACAPTRRSRALPRLQGSHRQAGTSARPCALQLQHRSRLSGTPAAAAGAVAALGGRRLRAPTNGSRWTCSQWLENRCLSGFAQVLSRACDHADCPGVRILCHAATCCCCRAACSSVASSQSTSRRTVHLQRAGRLRRAAGAGVCAVGGPGAHPAVDAVDHERGGAGRRPPPLALDAVHLPVQPAVGVQLAGAQHDAAAQPEDPLAQRAGQRGRLAGRRAGDPKPVRGGGGGRVGAVCARRRRRSLPSLSLSLPPLLLAAAGNCWRPPHAAHPCAAPAAARSGF